jgi:molecular chaperone GrpE
MATTGKAADTEHGPDAGAAAHSGAGADTRAEQQAPAPGSAGESGAGEGRAAESGAEQQLAELEDRWRRAVAELDNQRKRFARDLGRERAAERAKVAAAWLQVLDNLELALGHATTDTSPLAEGVRAIRDQAVDVLGRLGFPRQDESGVPFDPTRHEVVTVLDDPDAPPGTVVRVLRPGYGEADNQLRPMAVAVSKQRE